ncbi:phosphate propanoyltransferase [bacterium]|nr:phosphate propanoyltransferase [bacterium]
MKKLLVETSARHVHLSKKEFEYLFGEGKELTVKKYLSQPGQFVSEEKVNLVGPKKSINGVSILGPLRKEAQVEISLTDARTLGVNALVRESGDIDGTSGITITSLDGSKSLTLEKGVIAAKRHIHATEEDAKEMNLTNGEIVSVKINTKDRSLIFDDVVVRVRNDFAFYMHIDTDESNAANASGEVYGEIIKK